MRNFASEVVVMIHLFSVYAGEFLCLKLWRFFAYLADNICEQVRQQP